MLTELEMRADEEARHAHRELAEKLQAKLAKLAELVDEIRDTCADITEQSDNET